MVNNRKYSLVSRLAVLPGLAAVLGLAFVACGEDWPTWGHNAMRNAVSAERGLPETFSTGSTSLSSQPALAADGEKWVVPLEGPHANIRWIARLGSESMGTPTVSGGRVYVGTNNAHPRDDRFVGDRGVLLCLDERTGRMLWQLAIPKYPRTFGMKLFDLDNLGLTSSVTVEGDRVYLVSSRCEVLCLDARGQVGGDHGAFLGEGTYLSTPGQAPVTLTDRDGDILWQFDMIAGLGVRPHEASNSAVLVYGDYAYAGTSNGINDSHKAIEAPDAPSLVVLNKRTGELVAIDDAHIGPEILHGQWSSPALGMIEGKGVIFYGGGDGRLYAFDATPWPAAEGTALARLHRLWSYDCNWPEQRMVEGERVKYPSAAGPSEIIATPVFHKGKVYVSTGQDPSHGDGPGGLFCIDAAGTDGRGRGALVWSRPEVHRTLASVAATDDILVHAETSGLVRCLNPLTGKEFWRYAMKGKVWATPLIADGKIYLADDRGDLAVLAAGRELKEISRTHLEGPILASPIAANGAVYVTTKMHLYCIAAN